MRLALICMVTIALTGCANRAEIEARQQAAADAKCRSYGVLPGSQAYIDCRMAIDRDRTARQMVNSANQAATSAALISAGTTLMTNGR